MSLTFPIVNHIFFLRSICLCSYSNLSLILVVVCSDRVFIHLLFKRYLLNLIVYVVIDLAIVAYPYSDFIWQIHSPIQLSGE